MEEVGLGREAVVVGHEQQWREISQRQLMGEQGCECHLRKQPQLHGLRWQTEWHKAQGEVQGQRAGLLRDLPGESRSERRRSQVGQHRVGCKAQWVTHNLSRSISKAQGNAQQ